MIGVKENLFLAIIKHYFQSPLLVGFIEKFWRAAGLVTVKSAHASAFPPSSPVMFG
jgi:hypothetical protein